MPRNPALEQFRSEVSALRGHPMIALLLDGDLIQLQSLTTDQVYALARLEAGYYFLIAAGGLDRTAIKREMKGSEAKLVAAARRRAHVIKARLPVRASFSSVAETAIALRNRDLQRKRAGTTEALFRERLAAEGIPVLMSPPIRSVPGVLIGRRKPDGVYPDPSTGKVPRLYIEVKRVRRVADDIQKRLYEIAEASLEMKMLYGTIELRGLGLSTTEGVLENAEIRAQFRERIRATGPIVVALLLCSKVEAERYRAGGEAFIDRIFFEEEIEECIAFLREATRDEV